MSADAYVAFGGVALLGLVGFWVAWFSSAGGESFPGNAKALKGRQRAKKKIVAEAR